MKFETNKVFKRTFLGGSVQAFDRLFSPSLFILFLISRQVTYTAVLKNMLDNKRKTQDKVSHIRPHSISVMKTEHR